MVAIRSRLTFGPNRIRAGIDAFRTATPATRAEEGCVEFGCCADLADPDTLVVFEVWESQAALDDHLATLHVQVLADVVGRLARRIYASHYAITPAEPSAD